MEEKVNDPKVEFNNEIQTKETNKSPDTKNSSDNNKSAKSLGDGRWKYQGKVYKEEPIGRS